MPDIAPGSGALSPQSLDNRSRVQAISQTSLKLLPATGQDVFQEAQKLVLDWIDDRAGQQLPPEAWRGEGFELDDVGTQRTAAVAIDQPRYWAARLDDGDRSVAKRTWVTEIGLAETANREVVFGARLQCATTGGDFPIQPSIPSFVRRIVERMPAVSLEERRIDKNPWIVTTDEDVDDLVDLIELRSRLLDVVVCSLPEHSDDPGEAMIDVARFHRQTLGAAHVAVISGAASFALTERLGREFSVFRCAVRTYRTQFDNSVDEPFRHPLTLPERIAAWESGSTGYERFLVGQTILRSAARRDPERDLPPFAKVKRIALQLRRTAATKEGASLKEQLDLANKEIEELQATYERDTATYLGLAKQYEDERDRATDELQQVQATNGHLQQRLRALQARLESLEQKSPAVTVPATLENFEPWCRDNLSGAVEVHNRAFNGVKKCRYEDIGLLYYALLLLRDYYVPMRVSGGADKKEAFEKRCIELGLAEEPTFSGTLWGEQGETYKIRYAGRSRMLDRHLKKGTSREERLCFRLYFFWDDDNEQAVVGWLPSHLDTRAT